MRKIDGLYFNKHKYKRLPPKICMKCKKSRVYILNVREPKSLHIKYGSIFDKEVKTW